MDEMLAGPPPGSTRREGAASGAIWRSEDAIDAAAGVQSPQFAPPGKKSAADRHGDAAGRAAASGTADLS